MAAGATYEPIATYTATSNITDYTFTSIPGTYTDLVLISAGTVISGDYGHKLQFNGDTGSNYSSTFLYGDGSSATSGRTTTAFLGARYGSGQSNGISHIMNYANTTTYKTGLSRGNNPGALVISYVALWRSTAAITSIKVIPESSSFVTGTTFTLYGIAAA